MPPRQARGQPLHPIYAPRPEPPALPLEELLEERSAAGQAEVGGEPVLEEDRALLEHPGPLVLGDEVDGAAPEPRFRDRAVAVELLAPAESPERDLGAPALGLGVGATREARGQEAALLVLLAAAAGAWVIAAGLAHEGALPATPPAPYWSRR